MKKRVICFAIMLFALFIGNVHAATQACPLQPKSQLREMASNVSVTYVPVSLTSEDIVDDQPVGNTKYLDVYVYNMNSKMNLEVTSIIDGVSKTSLISGSNASYYTSDGAMKFRFAASNKIINLKFKIYGSRYEYDGESYDCSHTVLRTLNLTLPKFNYYSNRTICNDIPEYYLCQEFVTYDINGETFFDDVTEYKEKLAEKANEKNEESNTSVVSKTINGLAKYKFVVAGVIVLAGVVITVIVIKKKRSAF